MIERFYIICYTIFVSAICGCDSTVSAMPMFKIQEANSLRFEGVVCMVAYIFIRREEEINEINTQSAKI